MIYTIFGDHSEALPKRPEPGGAVAEGVSDAGKAVYIMHCGSGVMLVPETKGWDTLFSACEAFTRNGVRIERDQPPPEVRLPLYP